MSSETHIRPMYWNLNLKMVRNMLKPLPGIQGCYMSLSTLLLNTPLNNAKPAASEGQILLDLEDEVSCIILIYVVNKPISYRRKHKIQLSQLSVNICQYQVN